MIWLNLEPTYISSFIFLGKLIERPFGVIGETLKEIISYYMGAQAIFYGLYETTGILFLLGAVSYLGRLTQSGRTGSRNWISAGFILLMLMSIPFLLNPLSGGSLPVRTFVAVPFVYWFVATMALRSPSAGTRVTAKALVLLVGLQYFQLSSFASLSQQFVAAHDELIASQVYQEIVKHIDNFDRDKVYAVDFSGPLHFSNGGATARGRSGVTGRAIASKIG